MADFPDIQMPEEIERTVRKAQVRSDFEAGYTLSRARETRERRIFILSWGAVSGTDYDSLEAHFIANVGGSFSWTDPRDSTSYTVQYTEDQLPEGTKYMGYNFYGPINGLRLEEV